MVVTPLDVLHTVPPKASSAAVRLSYAGTLIES